MGGIKYTTIRINVTGPESLDGFTLFTGTPATGLVDPETGIVSYTIAGPVGRFDLADIIGDFSVPLVIQGISVEGSVNPHEPGTFVTTVAPAPVDNPAATRKRRFAFALDGTNGVLPDTNVVVPIDHQIGIDTEGDAVGMAGPHTIQFSIARADDGLLNRLLAVKANSIKLPSQWLNPVRVVLDTNRAITNISEGNMLNGVRVESGDGVLLVNQTDPIENGIYTVQDQVPAVRRKDMSTDAEISFGVTVRVQEGDTNAGSAWTLSRPNASAPNLIGVTAMVFLKSAARSEVFSFVQADLVGDDFTATHTIGTQYVNWTLYNNVDVAVITNVIAKATNAETFAIDLGGQTPITGTWKLVLVG